LLAGRLAECPLRSESDRHRELSQRADAVEKGKNEPTEIFACAPAETGFV
jgi:hypothetical protein